MAANTVTTVLVITEPDSLASWTLFRTVLDSLQAHPFKILQAQNGRCGVEIAQQQPIDLIVCTSLQREMNEHDVLNALRRSSATAVIPFILITPEASRSHLRKTMELGASDYLVMPFAIEELVQAMITQVEKQAMLQQWYGSLEDSASHLPSPPAQDKPRSSAAPAASTTPTSDHPTTHTIFGLSVEGALVKPPLNEVFQFIEANYHHSITLGDVARAVGYSPAYLTNLTRVRTGQTIQRWIIERRMAAAKRLLLETDCVVEQIAAKVGYQHSVHFFRQFRQIHGTTPQNWRNHQRLTMNA